MWIPILIIVLVVAMAIGPIMWFRSTPYQRRIIKFRSHAAELGLRVQVKPLADLGIPAASGGMDTVVAYGLPWVQSGREETDASRRPGKRPWRLVKERMEHDSHFAGWWNWQKGLEADRRWHGPLREQIPQLPEDALALENDRRALWLYWRERGGIEGVDQVAAILRSLKETGGEY